MAGAVLFDLDGVLIHSERIGWRAWREFLFQSGQDLSLEEYRTLIGMPSSAPYIRQRFGLSMPLEDIVADHRRRLLRLLDEDLRLAPAARELIRELRLRGYLLGIASNSFSQYVARVLEITALAAEFSVVLSADQVTRGKPAPDVYLEAAARLGLAPNSCLAVEDSPPGEEAALAAGMRCVLVPNPDLPGASFSGTSPTYPTLNALLDSLDQVL